MVGIACRRIYSYDFSPKDPPKTDRPVQGHALNGALVLSIYIRFVGIMCGSSGAYFTAFALSFVAPVLAEAINPADVDLLHALTSPTLGSLVFALLHSAINSVDRLYLSEWPRPPA